jgi:tetratricopeptide (TPR) repeat protein
MHFRLGYAYFEVENWEFSRQSYEKAAELNPLDAAAAFNVALSFARLGYYRDAAKWLEEVLRREPNHRDRQEIVSRIQLLRR